VGAVVEDARHRLVRDPRKFRNIRHHGRAKPFRPGRLKGHGRRDAFVRDLLRGRRSLTALTPVDTSRLDMSHVSANNTNALRAFCALRGLLDRRTSRRNNPCISTSCGHGR
jgi:hypothetical protein